MQIARARLVLSVVSFGLLAALGCESSSTPSAASPDGSITPTEDGAACGCQTPDCLPNCSDLPVCKLVCVDGVTLDWVDSCGTTDYAQACDAGCADAAAVCQ